MGKKKYPKKDRLADIEEVELNPFEKLARAEEEQSGPNLSFLKHMELLPPEWTDKQKRFLRTLTDTKTNMVILTGPAGTSKTFIAVYAALQMLKAGHADKIVYVRSIAESASKSIGALPGSVEEKFQIFSLPLLEKIDEIVRGGKGLTDKLISKKIVEPIPINFLRGASMNNTIVVADECQNLTRQEKITLSTRIGKNSKLFICGDINQSDIGNKSGLEDFKYLFDDDVSRQNGVHCCEFTKEDIVRSEFVRFLVGKFETLPQYNHGNR